MKVPIPMHIPHSLQQLTHYVPDAQLGYTLPQLPILHVHFKEVTLHQIEYQITPLLRIHYVPQPNQVWVD
jgi:hypothetical protein